VYPAQYGYGAGGQVLVTMKSGTNSYHGSGFEFIRNQAVLTARNFFQTGPTRSFKSNQFGCVIGGPIRKDKTFFFFSYEGLQLAQAIVLVGSVPGRRNVHRRLQSVAAKYTTEEPMWRRLCREYIPQSQISPIGQNQLDHQFSSKDSGFITANYFNEKATERINQAGCAATPLPLFGCDTFIRHQLYGIQETHIFSASMVNEVRVAATYELTPAIVQTTYRREIR
jgi:hypothetical protein